MRTFKELFLWAESGFGGKEAIVDVDRGIRWTYDDLGTASRSICAAYRDGGVQQHDRVGWLAMAPGADVTALSFGARKMGAIPVAMNGRAAPEQLAWMINNVEMTALSYTEETSELLERLRHIGIPTVRHFIAVDEPISSDHERLTDVYARFAGADEPAVAVGDDDIALIIYTSGSTGRPKPVMHAEARFMENMMDVAYQWGMCFDDRYLSIMPPHFAGWAHGTCGTLRAGASQVCLRFTPSALARAIADERASHIILSPTMVRMIRIEAEADPSLFTDNDVRVAALGGEIATEEVLETLRRLFPKMQRVAGLGATEVVSLTTGVGNPRLGSDGRLLGKPLPSVTVELRDQETGEVITEAGVAGELYIRGPVAVGIWGDQEKTAANFPDGWWRSGDIVTRDADGYLYIAGRSDNVFKSGAIKVQCEEVEAILKDHPTVIDALVVPAPDARFGQVPHAFIRHQQHVSPAELEEWWRQRPDAAPYARPRHWTMWGEEPFPMVTAAKVDRQAFRRRAQELHEGAST